MTRSASSTVAEPGRNVAQKKGLNRSILDAAWGRFTGYVRYKAVRAGGELILVDPRHTSVACSGCGAHVPKTLGQRRHVCGCGTDLHRDENAARVILARGLAARAAGEGGQPLGDAYVGRKVVRRPGTAPRRLRAALETVRKGYQPQMAKDRLSYDDLSAAALDERPEGVFCLNCASRHPPQRPNPPNLAKSHFNGD